ncbi:MAG: MOSC domain-containing protein [Mesorhizobium sp.]
MGQSGLPFAAQPGDLPEILAGRKLLARVAGLYLADGDSFETRAQEALELDFDGIACDFHHGPVRKSGGREPWYPRGTVMRNERQLSIVSPDELKLVADRMEIGELKAEWLGANILLDGVPMLSMLPGGTKLFFKGGVTLKIDGQNAPCQVAGKLIAKRAGLPETAGSALLFPKSAKRQRGLVAWVEKPGRIEAGEEVSVRVPEQWIYRP